MRQIKCVIVDDEPTARNIMQAHIAQIDGIEIVATCKNAMEAIACLNNSEVDLMLLDIQMPDMTGMSLMKSIPSDVKVIFTTAYREYAIYGFDLQAVDYLLKPISLERLVKAIQKYRTENSNKLQSKDFLVVRSDRKMIKINFDEIVYIESLSDYLKIHTTSKTIITRETISAIEDKLPPDIFTRIHRSYIVSIPFISSYTSEYVEIENQTITISKSYRDSFSKLMQ